MVGYCGIYSLQAFRPEGREASNDSGDGRNDIKAVTCVAFLTITTATSSPLLVLWLWPPSSPDDPYTALHFHVQRLRRSHRDFNRLNLPKDLRPFVNDSAPCARLRPIFFLRGLARPPLWCIDHANNPLHISVHCITRPGFEARCTAKPFVHTGTMRYPSSGGLRV